MALSKGRDDGAALSRQAPVFLIPVAAPVSHAPVSAGTAGAGRGTQGAVTASAATRAAVCIRLVMLKRSGDFGRRTLSGVQAAGRGMVFLDFCLSRLGVLTGLALKMVLFPFSLAEMLKVMDAGQPQGYAKRVGRTPI